MNMRLLHRRPEAQANTKSSMMTNQIVVPVLAEALVIADGSYVKQMVIGTLLGSCRRW
jgi:hypothetical protein